jgi:hypothetical protein
VTPVGAAFQRLYLSLATTQLSRAFFPMEMYEKQFFLEVFLNILTGD